MQIHGAFPFRFFFSVYPFHPRFSTDCAPVPTDCAKAMDVPAPPGYTGTRTKKEGWPWRWRSNCSPVWQGPGR
ncbi:hypothetical protein HMPREF0262_01152 [Clostridium sp. ATCC 29733]|nr:hypothetical protein HMPREF0262_01152 [Clostridium sp. ATCC 29733]